MKFYKGLSAFLLVAGIILLPLNNNDNLKAENNVANGFEGVEIVTEDTYQPIDPDVSEELENVAMGSSIEQPKARMARASAPYWDESSGVKKFYDAEGNLMYHEGTKKVIDVSEHNGKIDWDKVKASGVDGAIIRVGWGYLGEDKYFQRNVSECNRLGIPYGVYLYSYAYDANFAYAEANGTAEMLSKVNLNLSYPIYYDIERFDDWNDNGTTRVPPKNAAEYEKVIGTYISRMEQLGYAGKVHVYSYRSYLQNQLNSPKILPYVSWIAAYTPTLGFNNTYYNGEEGWQYTSTGSVGGVSGRVDISCFSNQFYNLSLSTTIPSEINNSLTKVGAKFSSGYITGLPLGTNLDTIVKELSNLGVVTCYNSKGSTVNGGSIATGITINVTITKPKDLNLETESETSELQAQEDIKTYTMQLLVYGDVNGDGNIYATDYVKIKNHIMDKSKLTGVFKKAADVNRDGNIYATDYVKIKNSIMGKGSIQQ